MFYYSFFCVFFWTSLLTCVSFLQVVPFSTNLTPQNPRTGLSSNPASGNTSSVVMSPPPDYPGLEYPPVFEPETYSLANPSCSLTLLRKQQQK